MKRAVKYCGGCNPRFDRAALVRTMEKRWGEPLPPARPGEDYDEVYVICGCSACCADTSQLTARRLIWLEPKDLPSWKE